MGLLEFIGILTTRVLLAFLVFSLGTIGASIAKRLVRRLLRESNVNRALALLNIHYNLEELGGIFAFYLVYVITGVVTLWLLGIASIVMWILLLLLAIAIAFSVAAFAKDLLPNLRGWYQLRRARRVIIGSEISLPHVSGTVEKVRLVETLVRSPAGDLLHVPNRLFWEK